MLEQEFSQLIHEFGVPVYVNREAVTRHAIIKNQKVNETLPNFDDKTIHTNWKLERGMTIVFEGTEYLIISDVQSKRTYEYKAVMRPMTNTIEYPYLTDGVYEYDRLGNKVWIEEPTVIDVEIPCIAIQDNTPSLTSGQIVLLDNRIQVIVPDDTYTEQLAINDNCDVAGLYYEVNNISLLQKGLRVFTLEWTARPS